MKIELTKAEVLVLSDWLYQKSKDDNYFDDDAIKCIFRNIECQLEKELIEVFDENYIEIVANAKKTVKESY